MMKAQDVDATARDPKLTVNSKNLLPDGTDAQFREMVHGLLAFSIRIESIRQLFGGFIGLSGIQYTILISIAHQQGEQGVGIKHLADHLVLSGAFVTIEVGKLVKLGLVDKRVNPKDRRRVLLCITDKAGQALCRLAPVQSDVNDVLFSPLSARDFNAMAPIAARLATSAEEALKLAEYLTGAKGQET